MPAILVPYYVEAPAIVQQVAGAPRSVQIPARTGTFGPRPQEGSSGPNGASTPVSPPPPPPPPTSGN